MHALCTRWIHIQKIKNDNSRHVFWFLGTLTNSSGNVDEEGLVGASEQIDEWGDTTCFANCWPIRWVLSHFTQGANNIDKNLQNKMKPQANLWSNPLTQQHASSVRASYKACTCFKQKWCSIKQDIYWITKFWVWPKSRYHF